MSVADLSEEKLKELASCLEDFAPVPKGSYDDDSEQYWYNLAVVLRAERSLGDEFRFNAHDLIKIGDKENSAAHFLSLLIKNKLNLNVFISCLKKIECQKALNVFVRTTTPIIKEQSGVRQMEVQDGGTITMSIEAECHPGPPVYQWFKDQRHPLPGQTTKTLLLHKANTGDTGYYHCRVTNPLINDLQKGCVFSEYVHVTVQPPILVNNNPTVRQEIGSGASISSADPPQVTLHPSSVTAIPKSQVRLECQAEGAVCYDWFRNGKSFKSEQRDGVLVLESFSATNAGEYFCEAVNDHGRSRSRSAKVTMGDAVVQSQEARLRNPEVIVFDKQPPEKLDIHVGDELILECLAHGRSGEQVSYEWFQGGDTRRGNEQVLRFKTDAINRRYKCKMYCRVSLRRDPHVVAQSRTTKLTIHGVWFTKQPQSIERAWIGQKAQLSCSAEGLGTIEYIWFKCSTKDGKFTSLTKKTNPTGVLYFNRLKQKDWGYYQCQASNHTGFVTSETVCLRPTIPSMKRRNSFKLPLIEIMKQPWSQIVKEGGRFRLLCEAVCTENVPLSYQWYYCGKEIHGATESAFIREPAQESDCGPYFCEVKCSSNPAVKPTVSKSARIELAPVESEDSKSFIVGKNIAQMDQMAGEEVCRTKKDERYAREKIALLIGNQNYQCADLNDLQSPENDIKELGNMLENHLGFKVITLLDLSHGEMMRALEFFYEMLAIPAVYALFYYSGHGFSSSKRNFLIPVNATVPLRCDHNIDVDTVCKQMRKKHSRAIVVLDCCRVEARIEESIPGSEFDSLPDPEEANNDSLSVANYVVITSTQDGNPAYDGKAGELSPASTPSAAHSGQLAPPKEKQFPCSNFNIAFREALEEKKQLYDVHVQIITKIHKLEQKGTIRPGQRPTFTGSLMDSHITLHDDVFLDDNANEPTLERILKLHEDVHYVPDTVLMEEPDQLGELYELVQLELSFSYDFTNVLCVHTRMHLLHGDKTSKANIEYDIGFIERQGVKGFQSECLFESPLHDSDVGGQGETPQLVSTMTRISNIQRVKEDVLKLLLKLSLYTEGKEVTTKVKYEFPKKPLFANLH